MTTKDALSPLLLVALVTASLLPFRSATPEGDALFAMMQKWSVVLPGWMSGGDPCSLTGPPWSNVSCRDGFVVELNVTNAGITGSLPSEIGSLQYLEVLDISNVYNVMSEKNNSLGGAFPDSLAQCTRLKSFNASNIDWNIDFPPVLTKLTALEELYFSGASLSGTIPDDFYNNLVNLRSLFLGNNNLKGSLQKLANLKGLVLLTAFQNDFTGTIPVELGNLANLEYLNCHTCNLYGGLPDSFSQLSNLQNLTIHRNNLTGTIPDSWKKLTNMRNLRMDQNYISGPFPSWMFTEWPSLNYLYITKNSFSGLVPNVTDLDVKYNVSYIYSVLKWDCNYFNGLDPCTDTNNCSAQIDSKITSKDFNFDNNCYLDASQKELGQVSTNCGVYHPTDLNCPDFYALTSTPGGCPRCPTNQVRWPEAGQCVCRLSGSSSSGGVTVGAVVGGVLGLLALFAVVIALLLYKRRKHFSFLDIFTIKGQRGGMGLGQTVRKLRVALIKSVGYLSAGQISASHVEYIYVNKILLRILGRAPLRILGRSPGPAEPCTECWEAPPGVERFSLQDLAKVTQDFNEANVIGQGGFGKVFVGTLPDGRMVAIKRAPAVRQYENAEFHNEVTLLSRLHHRNLVKLEGFCDDEGLQILVYEFVKNGNLHAHLLGKLTTTPLHWYRRLEIAYGVAQGLEYLHSFADPPVIHRDVKPSNILLDENMVAKVADFGISKVSPEFDTHVSTRPAGTAGYLDPDYFMRRQLTTASDVYAFGVVLLELVTGQEAIDHTRLEEFNLIEWVRKRFKTAGIVSIIDPLIENDYSPEAYSEMAKLGLRCASFDRHERPTMKVVLSTLEPFLVMQNLYPKADLAEKDGKKPHIAFETEYLGDKLLLPHTGRSTETSHTGRSTESNPFEIGRDMESLSGLLRPR